MKIRVTLKDPDTMPDSVQEAFSRAPYPDGLSEVEWEQIRGDRAAAVQSDITSRWMPYAEYLVVEFDTDAKTATVLPASAFK